VIVNPFMSREITAIMRILRSAGVDVVGAWNGSGYTTASFSHGKLCGTTLRAAIDRYQKGCPTHPQKGVFCRCNWLTNGYDTFRLPKKWS
jgi:hypothetical protein